MTGLAAARYAVRVAREGPSRVDAGPLIAALGYAYAAGINWRDMGRAAGMHWQQIERLANGRYGSTILRTTRTAILAGVDKLLAERAAALADAASAAEYAHGRPGRTERWPAGPLRELIERRRAAAERQHSGIGLQTFLADADRRYLYRSATLDTARAERVCRALDIYPETVWPDWFGLEEAG